MQKHVQTKILLCEIVQVTRKDLDNKLSLPNAPKKGKRGWNVQEVARFLADNAQRESNLQNRDGEFRSLKQREVMARCQKIEFDLQVAQGKYVLKDEVYSQFRSGFERVKQALLGLPVQLAAPFGEIGPQIQKHADDVIRESLEKLSESFRESNANGSR